MTVKDFRVEVQTFAQEWELSGSERVAHRLAMDLNELFLAETSVDAILSKERFPRYKIFLGVIGETGTGKGEFARYAQHEWVSVLHERYSTRVRELVRRWGIPETRANLQKIAMHLRSHFGDEILTKPILAAALHGREEYVVIEGIRLSGDIRDLRRLPGFKLVYVTAPVELCYQRSVVRSENVGDATKTFDEFKRDREAPTEIEIAELGAAADFRIENTGTLEQYRQCIWEIVSSLGSHRCGPSDCP